MVSDHLTVSLLVVSHFFFLSDCEDEEELLMSVSPATTTSLGTRCWHYKFRDDPKDRGSTYGPTLGTRHGAQEVLPVMGMHSPTTHHRLWRSSTPPSDLAILRLSPLVYETQGKLHFTGEGLYGNLPFTFLLSSHALRPQ